MNSPDFESPIDRWRIADKAATLAEGILIEHTLAYSAGTGTCPTEQEWETVRELRQEANRRFDELMNSAFPSGKKASQ